jgi:hypothetical protein
MTLFSKKHCHTYTSDNVPEAYAVVIRRAKYQALVQGMLMKFSDRPPVADQDVLEITGHYVDDLDNT